MGGLLEKVNLAIGEIMTRIGNTDLLGFFDTPAEAMRTGVTLGLITFVAILLFTRLSHWVARIAVMLTAVIAYGFYFGILG